MSERAVHSEDLQGGACEDLAPPVVDKYFMADGSTERFEHMTAKAICGRCAVQAACLEDAIVVPPGHGIRGGESASSIWRLHAEWMDKHVRADVLALRAIRQQKPLGGLRTTQALRAGQFPDVRLAYQVTPEGGDL